MQLSMLVSRSLSLTLLSGVLFLSCAGCGSSESIVPVSGTVTHNGNPVPGLVISFVPEGPTESGTSTGETDDNGKYELTVFKTKKKGAVATTHKVWVSRPRPPLEAAISKEERAKLRKEHKKPVSEKPPPDYVAILAKYGKLDKTPLVFEVKGGSPIDIKLD